jgi:hypothetical protein
MDVINILMKIAITGLPRSRTSQIVNLLSTDYNLIKPKNHWGETHKFDENHIDWLKKDQCVFKIWSPFVDDYSNILQSFSGNIIVSYTTDIPIFVAKLLRADTTGEWGTSVRTFEKISFTEKYSALVKLVPIIQQFLAGLDQTMSSKSIVLKSAFVQEDKVAIHVQSSFDNRIANALRVYVAEYKKPNLGDYFSEGKEEFYEYVCKNIGRTL